MEHVNPLFDRSPRNLPAPREPSRPSAMPQPSAETISIIRLLDVRFPPNNSTSEEDREAQVLLLASDVADIPAHLLRAAATEWVRTKAFMPKASELRNLAGQARKGEEPDERVEVGRRVAENYNQRLACETPDKGIRWVYDEKSDSLKLKPLHELRTQPEPRCTPEEAAEIRRMMRLDA